MSLKSWDKRTSEYITINVKDKVYFGILEVCLREQISLDKFVSDAIKHYIRDTKHKDLETPKICRGISGTEYPPKERRK
jgi:hypothetical protein